MSSITFATTVIPTTPSILVMLKGAWGAGKTYLIKNFLEERPLAASAKKDLYISLYGMTSIQQVEDGLYRQLHPILSSKIVTLVGRAVEGRLKKLIDIDQGLSLRDYFDTPKECLLVFDDLERCSVPITDALGYINYFVEHRVAKLLYWLMRMIY
jgi:hypothetical protein